MSNSKTANHKKDKIEKTSTNKVNIKPINKQIYELLAQLIEISLLLVAFGIVVEILQLEQRPAQPVKCVPPRFVIYPAQGVAVVFLKYSYPDHA